MFRVVDHDLFIEFMFRGLLAITIAGWSGALIGAVSLWLPMYFSNDSSFIGSTKSFSIFGAFIGATLGLIPGLIVGIAATKSNLAISMLLSAVVGLAITVILLSFAEPGLKLAECLSVPGAALIGLIARIIAGQPDRA